MDDEIRKFLDEKNDREFTRLYFSIREEVLRFFGSSAVVSRIIGGRKQEVINIEVGGPGDDRKALRAALKKFDEDYWTKRIEFSNFKDSREKRIWEQYKKKTPGLKPPCERAKGRIIVTLCEARKCRKPKTNKS